MRRFLTLLLLFIALGIILSVAPDRLLRPKLEQAFACHLCSLRIGSLGFSFFPFGLRAKEVELRQGDPRDSAVIARVKRALIPVSWKNFLPGPWRIGEVELEELNVVVHEGSAHFPSPPSESGKPPDLRIEGVKVIAGSFAYRKDSSAGAAWIRIPAVAATVGPISTLAEEQSIPWQARAEAQLEESGKIALFVAAKVFESGPDAEVDLRLSGQRLQELNPFFKVEDGVTLEGSILSAHSNVSVKNTQATGSAWISFEGLAIDFHKNRDRGALSALLHDLVAGFALQSGNAEEPDRHEAVVTRRHKGESVVSFVLRTMREAAIRVAQNKRTSSLSRRPGRIEAAHE